MKTTKKSYAIALALTFGLAATLKAQNLYIAVGGGAIGEYTTSGATVNAALITGLISVPWALAISGDDVFVANGSIGTIGEYTTSGATVNPSLITGLDEPIAIAIGPVPEPSAGALAGVGAAALWLWRRRK